MIPTNPPTDSANNTRAFPLHRARDILHSTKDTAPLPRFASLRTTNIYQATPKTRMVMTSLATQSKSPEVSSLFDYVKSLPSLMAAGASARAATVMSSPAADLRVARQRQPAATQTEKPLEHKKLEDAAADFRFGLFN